MYPFIRGQNSGFPLFCYTEDVKEKFETYFSFLFLLPSTTMTNISYTFQIHSNHSIRPPPLKHEMWLDATALISRLEGNTFGRSYRVKNFTVVPRGDSDPLFIAYIVERTLQDTWIFHTALYPTHEICPLPFIDLVDHDTYDE